MEKVTIKQIQIKFLTKKIVETNLVCNRKSKYLISMSSEMQLKCINKSQLIYNKIRLSTVTQNGQ